MKNRWMICALSRPRGTVLDDRRRIGRVSGKKRCQIAAAVEPLERRTLLTAVVVNTIQDGLFPAGTGTVSIRNAVATANAATDPVSITFDPTVFAAAQTITLNGSALHIENATGEPVVITGPAAGVTIDANNASNGLVSANAGETLQGVTLSNMTFTHCQAAISATYTILSLSNVTITGNSGAGIAEFGGGTGSMSLTNVRVTNNGASSAAGGIDANETTLTMNNVTVSNNTGTGVQGTNGSTILNSTISNNTGTGLIADNKLVMINDTVSGNTAASGDAGITSNGPAVISNCTITANHADDGVAGIDVPYDFGNNLLTLQDDTVVGNVADYGHGGVYNAGGASAVTVVNTIIAGNTITHSPTDPGVDASGTFTSLGYNLIGTTGSGMGWFSLDQTGTVGSPLDPQLGALANNGGPTQTMLPAGGSPVVDRGSIALLPPGLSTDQRGLDRIRNGAVDVGAVEVQVGSITPVVTPSVTILVSSTPNVNVGQNVRLVATVASSVTGGVPPTGTVDFIENGATLGSANVQPDGTATFVSALLAAGTHSISASYTGDSGYAPSSSVVVVQTVNSAPATKLAFASTPATAEGGVALTPPVTVDVEDAGGNIAASDNSTVTLSIASGPAGGHLGGNVTAAVINGVATFPDITLSPAGAYTLTASDGSLTPTTSPGITVSAGTSVSPITPTLGQVVLPASVIAGAKTNARVSVVLTNRGAKLTGTYTINLFVNGATILDGNQIFVAKASKHFTFSTGKGQAFNFNLKVFPAGIVNGSYHLLAEVTDPSGASNVVASSQSINVAAPFVSLAAAPSAVKPPTISVGKSGAIAVTVTDNGNEDATGPIKIVLGLSSDGVSPLPGIMLGSVTKSTRIKAGQKKPFALHFKIGSTPTAGAYFPYFTISLDGVSTTAIGSQFSIG